MRHNFGSNLNRKGEILLQVRSRNKNDFSSSSSKSSSKQRQPFSSSPPPPPSSPPRGSRTSKDHNRRRHNQRLPNPDIIFSSNHLLVVNKPAGYHSQPNDSAETLSTTSSATQNKCLLTTLKRSQNGGGSAKDFLLPMHRLDQPCTGVLVLAKTSKAGTRVGNAFRKHTIQKDYFCVVEGRLEDMVKRSKLVSSSTRNCYTLSGVFQPKQKSNRGRNNNNSNKSGGSVQFTPLPKDREYEGTGRVCHLEWEHLITIPSRSSSDLHLIRVKTSTGAKHQVRAMLSQLGRSPLAGDLRYGAKNPLPDQSVALHARSLSLPTVQLGDMDLTRPFIAPLPKTWSTFFSLTEDAIPKIDY